MSTLDNWNIKVNGMFTFFGILSPCFVLLKVILRFGKTVLLTLYSGWQIGRSTWGSGFFLLELFWQLILKTITVARNFQLQFLFLNLIAVSYENSQTEFWKRGYQRVYKWYVIKAKINMWRVNFTEKRSSSVNLWSSVGCDLPPEI